MKRTASGRGAKETASSSLSTVRSRGKLGASICLLSKRRLGNSMQPNHGHDGDGRPPTTTRIYSIFGVLSKSEVSRKTKSEIAKEKDLVVV